MRNLQKISFLILFFSGIKYNFDFYILSVCYKIVNWMKNTIIFMLVLALKIKSGWLVRFDKSNTFFVLPKILIFPIVCKTICDNRNYTFGLVTDVHQEHVFIGHLSHFNDQCIWDHWIVRVKWILSFTEFYFIKFNLSSPLYIAGKEENVWKMNPHT